MSGTALTTVSPSSSSRMRSTPCVDGCCGPMFRTIVLAAPVAVSTVVVMVLFLQPWQVSCRNVAEALDRIITPQGMAFPLFRQQNAAQIGVIVELNAHEVEDFPLQPASAEPNGNERIYIRMITWDARAEADLLSFGDGSKVIVQLKARPAGEAVNASGVRKQIKLQGVATFLRSRAQKAVGNDDRGFAV